jgi:hypothetical protein
MSLRLADLPAQLSKRILQEPGHVHLRKTELRGDTTLADVPEVVKLHDSPLASRQRAQPGLDQRPFLALLEPLLGARVARGGAVALERHGAHDNPFEAGPARDAHRLRAVAQVPPDLAHDGGDGIRREGGAATRVVPVDRLDQPDRSDLSQVLEVLPAAGEPLRERPDERQVQLNQPSAGIVVSILTPGSQELLMPARHDLDTSLPNRAIQGEVLTLFLDPNKKGERKWITEIEEG